MSEIVVPKWGLTTEEVTLTEWYVDVGDRVTADQPVAEVETDKATQEIVSPVAGAVTELLVAEGDDVPVGQPIAKIDPS